MKKLAELDMPNKVSEIEKFYVFWVGATIRLFGRLKHNVVAAIVGQLECSYMSTTEAAAN